MAQTGTRHLEPSSATVTSGRTGPKLLDASSNLRLLRRAQNDAVRHDALSHEPPQGDQKLARQGHDHELARTAASWMRQLDDPHSNVMSGVFIIGIVLSLAGLLVPIPLMALGLLTGAVQA